MATDGVLVLIASALLLLISPVACSQVSSTITITNEDNSDATITLLSPEEISLTQPLIISVKLGFTNVGPIIGKTLYLDVTTKNKNIIPEYTEKSFAVLGEGWVVMTKNISVKFNLSNLQLPLLNKPLLVTVNLSLERNQSTSNVVHLTEGRADIGFQPAIQQRHLPCRANSSCDLALTIKMSTVIPTLDMTLTLFNSTEHKVNDVDVPVSGENLDLQVTVVAPSTGSFTASLTVPKEQAGLVHWSRQNLTITVEQNKWKAELNSLTEQYEELSAKYDMLMSNYTTLSSVMNDVVGRLNSHFGDDLCDGVHCGDFGKCKIGKCECTHPKVYSGNACDEFVGCDGQPCGNRGSCSKPTEVDDMYECVCNRDDVTGKNCTECRGGDLCNGHGDCFVNDTKGTPQCRCEANYGGNYCEYCTEGWTGDDCQYEMCRDEDDLQQDCDEHGFCYYDNNITQCYCEDGYEGAKCDKVEGSPVDVTMTTLSPSPTPLPSSVTPSESSSDDKKEATQRFPSSTEDEGNSNLLYGGLIIFIAVLVVCVVAYLAYHNKDKIMDLLGWKKESVVEMAMRTRTKKNKGYQKLPTSIHDTVTHED